jgi:hypothetical protein
MPSQKFALVKGGPKRLQIHWKWFSQERVVIYDGKPLMVFRNWKALRDGGQATFTNGLLLMIKSGSLWGAPYDIRINGHPLPYTDGDPQQRVNNTAAVFGFIAFINILLGFIAASGTREIPQVPREFATLTYVIGVIYAILGLCVWRASFLALLLGIIGYGLDTLVIILSGLEAIADIGVTWIILRPLILIMFVKASVPVMAIRDERDRNPPANASQMRLEMSLLLVAVVLTGVIGFILVSRLAGTSVLL